MDERDVAARTSEALHALGHERMPHGQDLAMGQFVTAVVEKLATYALGREVQYFDKPALRGIVRAAAADDYRWSSVMLALVESTPFQMRRAGS
jgi:hypothetical protein